jgi:hypothetical protein
MYLDSYSPVALAALSKICVCNRSQAEIVGSNPARGIGCLSPVIVACCQVEASASGTILRREDCGVECYQV